MNQCIRCRVVRDTKASLCPVCMKEINELGLWNRRTEHIIWGLTILRLYGEVTSDAQHDELTAGLPDGFTPTDADHQLIILSEDDGGLNWHYDEDEGYYGFFT